MPERIDVVLGEAGVLPIAVAVDRGLSVSRDAPVIVDLAGPGLGLADAPGAAEAVDPGADAPRFAVALRPTAAGELTAKVRIRLRPVRGAGVPAARRAPRGEGDRRSGSGAGFVARGPRRPPERRKPADRHGFGRPGRAAAVQGRTPRTPGLSRPWTEISAVAPGPRRTTPDRPAISRVDSCHAPSRLQQVVSFGIPSTAAAATVVIAALLSPGSPGSPRPPRRRGRALATPVETPTAGTRSTSCSRWTPPARWSG